MAVTFDNNQNLSDMVHFDGISTHTDRNKTTGDFFNDNDVVGACLYFTWDRGVWHDLVVNVGTVLVADAITIVWEYYKSGVGWIAIPGVVDNTNAFQNAGMNTVAFSVPAEWKFYKDMGINTNDGLMIRARITAVTNISEGGANQTTAIYGKDYAIKITGDETPATIKTADTAGGWGVVNNTENYYQIISNLRLEGNLVIRGQILDVGTNLDRRVILKTSGILQLGYKDGSNNIYDCSALYYWNADTISMFPYNYWYGTLNMYNSILWKKTGGFGDYGLQCALDVQSSVLEANNGVIFLNSCTGSVKNITFSLVNGTNIYWYSANCTIDNLIFGKAIGILAGSNGVIVTNTDFGTTKRFAIGNDNRSIYAKNCDFDNPATQAYCSGPSNKIYVKYTLELTILDENNNLVAGYSVKLTDSQGNVINNGAWVDQDITTHLSETDALKVKTDTNYNPFILEVRKAGYKTYKTKFTVTNSNRKLTIALQKVLDNNFSKKVQINNY